MLYECKELFKGKYSTEFKLKSSAFSSPRIIILVDFFVYSPILWCVSLNKKFHPRCNTFKRNLHRPNTLFSVFIPLTWFIPVFCQLLKWMWNSISTNAIVTSSPPKGNISRFPNTWKGHTTVQILFYWLGYSHWYETQNSVHKTYSEISVYRVVF